MKKIISCFLSIILPFLALGTIGIHVAFCSNNYMNRAFDTHKQRFNLAGLCPVPIEQNLDEELFDYPKMKSAESTNGGIEIKWHSPKEELSNLISYYQVFRQTLNESNSDDGRGNEYDYIGDSDRGETYYFYKGVENGKIYKYTVVGKYDSGDSFAYYDINGISCNYFETPKINSYENTEEGLKLTWKKIEGVYVYRVFYYSPTGWRGIGDTTENSFVANKLFIKAIMGSKCTFTVRGIDENGICITGYDSDGFKVYKVNIGDVDCDGKVTINDVTDIQRYLVYLMDFTDEQLVAADVDGDGCISINDATFLQSYLALLVKEYYDEKGNLKPLGNKLYTPEELVVKPRNTFLLKT